MQWVLIVEDTERRDPDVAPFIPDSDAHLVTVYGPYESQHDASDGLRTFLRPGEHRFNLSIYPLHSLSEELSNPGGNYWWGDSPDL